MQYGFTKKDLPYLNTEEISKLPVKVKKVRIDYSSILYALEAQEKAMQYSCTEIWSIEYTCDQGMVCPNCECGTYDWVLTYRSCSWYDDGTGSGGSTGGGSGSGGGGGGSNDGCEGKALGDDCESNPEGIYSPTSPDMVEFYEKQFIKFLSNSDSSLRDYYMNDLEKYRKEQIVNYLIANDSSLESKIFAVEGVKAWRAGGIVDFDEQVILDFAFKNNSRLYGIYEEMGEASKFTEYLKNFEPNMSVAHLQFGYDVNFGANYPNYTTAMAVTNEPQNYLIKIDFNGDSNLYSSIHTKPDLMIALGFIHEIIHAEIFRKMLSAAQNGNLDPNTMTQQQQIDYANNLRNNFPGIYDYYWERYRPDWNHQQMAQHYRTTIINAISEYDNNQHSPVLYSALSWTGLMGTGQYDPHTGLYANSTEAWKYINI